MPFGIYKGVPISELPIGYVEWLYQTVELYGSLQTAVQDRLSEAAMGTIPGPTPIGLNDRIDAAIATAAERISQFARDLED
jgi:hypothetical protein